MVLLGGLIEDVQVVEVIGFHGFAGLGLGRHISACGFVVAFQVGGQVGHGGAHVFQHFGGQVDLFKG